ETLHSSYPKPPNWPSTHIRAFSAGFYLFGLKVFRNLRNTERFLLPLQSKVYNSRKSVPELQENIIDF
ncbi:MAG: hypothetical protein ACPGVP_22395, partial [Thiolinea sp.]